MHIVLQVQFPAQRFCLFLQFSRTDHRHFDVRLAFLQSGAQTHQALGILLISQTAEVDHVEIVGIFITVPHGKNPFGVDDVVQHAALFGEQPVEHIPLIGAVGDPENMLRPEARQQIGDGLRGQSSGVVGVVMDVGDQRYLAAAQRRDEAGAHVVGMDDVRPVLPNHPAEGRGGQLLHAIVPDAHAIQNFPDFLAFQTAIGHVHPALKGFDDLGGNLFRAGVNFGIQNVQYLHVSALFSFIFPLLPAYSGFPCRIFLSARRNTEKFLPAAPYVPPCGRRRCGGATTDGRSGRFSPRGASGV